MNAAGNGVKDLLARCPQQLEVAAHAAGVAPHLRSHLRVEALPCELTNLTTSDLARVRFGDGPSVIVKIARPPSLAPLWNQIPEQFRQVVMAELPWRAESDVYMSPLASLLPKGLRMPAIYAVDELDDDHVAVWMEDVPDRATPWDVDDYRDAARALGRLAATMPEERVPSTIPVRRRDLRDYFFGRIVRGTMPALRDDATWRHPRVAGAVDTSLRADLETLASSTPQLLDALDELPRSLAHGDACPQNLLRSTEPGSFVAIDWTFAGIAPLGLDAGQLLAGHAESGELHPAALPDLLDDIIAAYTGGLTEGGLAVDSAAVRLGVVGHLVVRSAFTALPLERLHDERNNVVEELFRRRAGYARFLVDLGLALIRDRHGAVCGLAAGGHLQQWERHR